jgi:TonB family protein
MTSLDQLRWGDKRVLVFMLVASFAIHGLSFVVFRVTDQVKTTGWGQRPRVGWLPAPSLERGSSVQYAVADALDPSLMSLPNARGFSKKMWERGVGATQRGAEWQSEPAFLDEKPVSGFPSLLQQRALVEFVQAAVARSPALPAMATSTADEELEAPPAINESVFRVTGMLEARSVVRAPRIPTLTSELPVRPTRVRAGVAADGTVRFAVLERSSGNEMVDARAVELARQLRFEPATGADATALTWGVLRFLWATESPPPATPTPNNGAGKGTQP